MGSVEEDGWEYGRGWGGGWGGEERVSRLQK